MRRSRIERTGQRVERWRVLYPADEDEGMDTETTHLTRLGARFSRWFSELTGTGNVPR